MYCPTPLEFGLAARCRALGGFLLLLKTEVPPLHLERRPPNRLLRYKISLFEEPQAPQLAALFVKGKEVEGYAVNLSSKEAKRSRGQRSARKRLLAAAVVGAVVVGAVGWGLRLRPDSGLHPLTADVVVR